VYCVCYDVSERRTASIFRVSEFFFSPAFLTPTKRFWKLKKLFVRPTCYFPQCDGITFENYIFCKELLPLYLREGGIVERRALFNDADSYWDLTMCVAGGWLQGVHKSWTSSRPGDWILLGSDWYFWVLSMEVALFLPSGAQKFDVTSEFPENLCTSVSMDGWMDRRMNEWMNIWRVGEMVLMVGNRSARRRLPSATRRPP
jgi:hypothetical protein